MAWAEKFKLNKQLVRSVTELGYAHPKEVQLQTLKRIIGGQDVVTIAPGGSGKTVTHVLATLNRFKHTAEGVPMALILTSDQDKVFDILAHFERINKNKTIRIVTLHAGVSTEHLLDELADGADIVIATPDKARAIYLKLALNLNKVELLVIDDAQLIVKKGLQLPTVELANSIGKAQRLVFTEVMHDKLEKMIAPFMDNATTIEIEEAAEEQLPVLPQMLYNVPNFGTKLNLLNLFLQDEEVFTKAIVFVNTRQTADTIYKSLNNRLRKRAALIKPLSYEHNSVDTVDAFKTDANYRVLIIANEIDVTADLEGLPFVIHFDIPAEKELYIARVETATDSDDNQTLALTFATDIELDEVVKIEQATGQKMQRAELPDELVIEKDRKQKEAEKAEKPKQNHKVDPNQYVKGEAFHQKKPENAKTYNYPSSMKAKMNKKKKH
ncbi:DEAD/DEAH box helicase [Mucilaginibacter pallidiroseus]|uniref:DEAD/DEAH box helicase n=1 Tax=Mucilaginibacter pallidiroseus TaxID=2599295 RepID=A0A563UJZ2_9SPHI|nr:DEAD/DEAH box helicase [Mucilaginibacter pallidiroseus]TWR31702.1 DEAD/DEAH box helicase [Mucilaginibacter pallidiroseus]